MAAEAAVSTPATSVAVVIDANTDVTDVGSSFADVELKSKQKGGAHISPPALAGE